MLLSETIVNVLTSPATGSADTIDIPRTVAKSLREARGQALVLTGVRRCGKSTLQHQLRRVAKSGKAVFCNLEDTRLYGFGPADFPTFLSVLDEFHAGASVYLDEIQEVPEWQRLVRALLDSGRKVCVTGSNASLLGRELGSKLTGRHVSTAVYPFSYAEFLLLRQGERGKATLVRYLQEGGFPAALREPSLGPVMLRELLRDIVHRDIVSRYALRDTRHLMNLALHLLAHTGLPLSLQSLAKGLAIPSVAQAARYVEYLQDAWLLLSLPRFSASFKQRVVSPPKYYAIDPGFRGANSPNPTPDFGRHLENAVLLALLRGGASPTYASEPHLWECDFVTPEHAVQVCAELTPLNRERELRGLLAAAKLPGAKDGRQLLVITLDQRDKLREGGHDITVVPAWEWLD